MRNAEEQRGGLPHSVEWTGVREKHAVAKRVPVRPFAGQGGDRRGAENLCEGAESVDSARPAPGRLRPEAEHIEVKDGFVGHGASTG